MKRFLIISILIILSLPILAQEEIRGIWINSDAMPKTKAEAVSLVNEYAKAGFNLLFPEVMCRGYAIYKSDILERDPRFVDCEDILPIIIEEAHALNMEVHPWVWCFRAGYTNHPGAIISAHPEWLECSKYGDTLSINGGMWISPINPDATNYLINIYKEIASNYDIDGFHLDYVRYESQNPVLYGYSQRARDKFKVQSLGKDPLYIEYLSPDYINWIEFRENHINNFVRNVSSELKLIKPNLIISAAVASNPVEARLNYMQNWPYWIDNGYIDLVIPMTYVIDNLKFNLLMKEQLKKADNKVWTAIGIGSHNFVKNEGKNIEQINIARTTDYMGQALFAAAYMTESLEKMLRENVWQNNANLPFRLDGEKSNEIRKYKANLKWVPSEKLQKYFPKNIKSIPTYEVHKKSTDINIDGYVDYFEWMPYESVNIRYNNLGEEIPYNTEVKMTYDEDAIYLSYRCVEPDMNKIKAEATERDGWTFYDDSCEVFINMDPSKYKYNHFSVNTLNTHFDQQIYNTSWNKDWESAIYKDVDMWSCEVKIPFSELSVATPKEGDMWKMNFTRNRWITGMAENLNWSVTYGSFHNLERFGFVYFK